MKHYNPCFDELIAHLLTFLPDIDPRFPDLLRPLLSNPFTVKNDLQIFKPGDIADYAFWPVEGFIRFYEKYKPHEEDSEEEFQKTISTSFPKKVSLCADSFMNQNPVGFCVEVLKGSTMVAFSHSAFQLIAAQIPQVAILALNILSDAEEDWKRRVQICRVRGLSGYQTFLDTFNNVEAFVFQKDIASCIGMTPKNLCDIRKKGGFSSDNLRK